jgi:hypothetical protein
VLPFSPPASRSPPNDGSSVKPKWTAALAEQRTSTCDGFATPTAKTAFTSKLKRFDAARTAAAIVSDQSPIWQNWNRY